MAVQLVAKSGSVRDRVSAEEWAARVDLAAGHRVLAHYGVNDLTYNHFGLRVPGEPEQPADQAHGRDVFRGHGLVAA